MSFDQQLRETKLKLARQLMQYREAAGLTVPELAAALGMHKDAIYKIEAGKVASIDTLAKILDKCGVTLGDFLAGFRSKDMGDEEKQEKHRRLGVILDSDFSAQAEVVKAAIDTVYEKVVKFKQIANTGTTGRSPPSKRQRA